MTTSGSSRGGACALLVFLAALVAVAHYRVAWLGETWVARDALELMLPARHVLGEALRQGRLPEWCATSGIGTPFAANPLDGATYPPAWIGALSPLEAGGDWIVLLHLVLGAAGAAALARRWGSGRLGAGVAGGIFATCGYVASMPANHNAQLLCWVPWVGWAADRVARPRAGATRRDLALDAALLAAAFAGQLIVGEPAHVAVSLLLAAWILCVRARPLVPALARAAAGLAYSVALAAASLLPALAVLEWTTRGSGLPARQSGFWSLAPLRLLEWIWPGMLGGRVAPGGIEDNLARVLEPALLDDPLRATWAFSVYFGVPALALAAWAAYAGRTERRLLALSGLFVALALGPATPLLAAVARVLPPVALARYPEKYLLGCVVVWSTLAGVGAGRLLRGEADRRLPALAAAGTLVLGACLGGAALAHTSLVRVATERAAGAELPFDAAAGVHRALSGGTLALAFAASFAALLWLAVRRRGRAWALAATALLLAELVAHGWSVNPTMPRAELASPPPLLAGLSAANPPLRVWIHSRRPIAPADLESGRSYGAYGWRSAGGHIALRFGHAALPGSSPLTSHALAGLLRSEQGPALLGTDYVVLADGLVRSGPFPVVARDPRVGASLLRAASARPRAFVAPRWTRSDAPLEALDSLPAPRDPGLVIIEGAGETPPPESSNDPVGPCSIVAARAERVELECTSRGGGYATLLDAHAPGWTAAVDGRERTIERADAVFRAVRVGPGPHRVVFRYRTPWLRAGAAVAVAAWLGWSLLVGLALRRAGPAPTFSSPSPTSR